MDLQLTLVAVFVSVALFVGSLTYVGLERSSPVRRRIRGLQGSGSQSADHENSALGNAPTTAPIVKKVTTFIPKSPKQMSKVQRRLAMAGFYKPKHIAFYIVSEVVTPAVMFGAVFLTLGRRGIIFAILAAIVGYLLPGMVVEYHAKKRQKEIRYGLPDALVLVEHLLAEHVGVHHVDRALLEQPFAIQFASVGHHLRKTEVVSSR